MKLLNLGCGHVIHPDWINIDSVALVPEAIECDVRGGLAFSDESLDVCYTAHMIEHLTPTEARILLVDVFRVLRPCGIIRVLVPDLELLANNYLDTLHRVVVEENREDDYDWSVIQLIDQTVRRSPGGEMSKFFSDKSRKNDDFVIEKGGLETEPALRRKAADFRPVHRSLVEKIRDRKPSWFIRTFRQHLADFFVKAIAGKAASNAFKEGLFRNSGEIHQWMYDRYSLARLLKSAGFSQPVVCSANDSQIPDFSSYELDVVKGRVRKPDSLFMEARKPTVSMGR